MKSCLFFRYEFNFKIILPMEYDATDTMNYICYLIIMQFYYNYFIQTNEIYYNIFFQFIFSI
jgi:hypothetical protein